MSWLPKIDVLPHWEVKAMLVTNIYVCFVNLYNLTSQIIVFLHYLMSIVSSGFLLPLKSLLPFTNNKYETYRTS